MYYVLLYGYFESSVSYTILWHCHSGSVALVSGFDGAQCWSDRLCTLTTHTEPEMEGRVKELLVRRAR